MKSEAKGQRHLIEPTQKQVSVLAQYIESIGGDRNILSEHPNEKERNERNQMIYTKWFQALVIHNQRFPTDIPVKFVLAHFARKVVQEPSLDMKGFNLRAQVMLFHQYLDRYERELRGKWWQYRNPDSRPKTLPESATRSEAEQEQSDEQRRKVLENMYGADKVPRGLRFWE